MLRRSAGTVMRFCLSSAALSCLLLALGVRSAAAESTSDGEAPDALPGLFSVPVAVVRPALSGSIAGSAGWGYGSGDALAGSERHRIGGTLAGALHVLPWLALGLEVHGRWEMVAIGSETDSGLEGWPALTLRAAFEPTAGFGLGLDVSAWMLGNQAPSLEPASTSLRGRLIASYRAVFDRRSSLTLTGTAGGLLDNSRAAAPRGFTESLSPADRLTLGVNDFSSVLAGVGVAVRIDALELLAEGSWRIHVGDGAPGANGWPLMWTVGARGRPMGEVLELGCYATLRMMEARGDFIAPLGYAVAIPPLFALTVQATIRLGVGDAPVPDPPAIDEPEPPAPSARTGAVRGLVLDSADSPVAGASVEVTPADTGRALVATTDAEGRWSMSDVPPGRAHLVIQVDGAVPLEEDIVIDAGVELSMPTRSLVPTPPVLPRGEIRGVVQSFTGAPLSGARIRIAPSGGEHTTDSDGAFFVQVAPGSYEVTISAPRHRSQTRRVEVQERGVVLLNAQLHRGR